MKGRHLFLHAKSKSSMMISLSSSSSLMSSSSDLQSCLSNCWELRIFCKNFGRFYAVSIVSDHHYTSMLLCSLFVDSKSFLRICPEVFKFAFFYDCFVDKTEPKNGVDMFSDLLHPSCFGTHNACVH